MGPWIPRGTGSVFVAPGVCRAWLQLTWPWEGPTSALSSSAQGPCTAPPIAREHCPSVVPASAPLPGSLVLGLGMLPSSWGLPQPGHHLRHLLWPPPMANTLLLWVTARPPRTASVSNLILALHTVLCTQLEIYNGSVYVEGRNTNTSKTNCPG